MASAIPKVPVHQPATRLEQERDKMLVAFERATRRNHILRSFPIVQSQYVQWNKDHPDYVEWLERMHIWEKIIEDTLKMPAAERGRGNSPLKKMIDTRWYPDVEEPRVITSEFESCPDIQYCWSELRDPPDGEILFTDDELLTAQSRLRNIISDPPSVPYFKVKGRISWAPYLTHKVFADLQLSLRFSRTFRFTPASLEELFSGSRATCEDAETESADIYIWAYPQGLSISRVTRLMAEIRFAQRYEYWRETRMYVLTPDLTYLEQLAQDKIGVIAYDSQKDRVYIPEGSYRAALNRSISTTPKSETETTP